MLLFSAQRTKLTIIMCFKLFGSRRLDPSLKISPITNKNSVPPGTKDAIKYTETLQHTSQQPGSMAPNEQEAVACKSSTVSKLTPAEVLTKFHMPPGLLPDTVTGKEFAGTVGHLTTD